MSDCDSEDHAPTVVADEGEYVSTRVGADAEGTSVIGAGSLEVSGSVSEHQRLEVKRLLVDAEVACVSKAPRLWWESGFLGKVLGTPERTPFPTPLFDKSLSASSSDHVASAPSKSKTQRIFMKADVTVESKSWSAT
eukprot:1749298-Amphidinium_carterae.1